MTKFVYGTGIALKNNWDIIKDKFNPDFAVDGNREKCGKQDSYTGLMCLSVDRLWECEQAYVLITIGDPYIVDEIREKLEQKGIGYKVLTEALDEWCADRKLPEDLNSLKLEQKKIILFNTPEHDNIGDHLITLSEMQYLKTHYSDYSICEVTDIEYMWYHNSIRKYVNPGDIILITGGGFLGSLWLYNGELNVRRIIQEYPDNRLIIMPQTVFFEQNDRGNHEKMISSEIYNGHKNLTICVREKESAKRLSEIVNKNVRIELLPDMALFYDAGYIKAPEKKEVLICLRKDKERVLTEGRHSEILESLCSKGMTVKETSMHSGRFPGIDKRKAEVDDKLREIKSAELVITDTLHCMISAAITGTPCIAFDNLSGKVKNVYQWIKDLPYIRMCEDISDFNELIDKVRTCDASYRLKDAENYISVLDNIIKEN